LLVPSSVVAAWHWDPEVVTSLTETQLSGWAHAAGVISEREDERRRREKFCAYCHKPDVFEGVCSNCKRPQPKQAKGPSMTDVVEWPPGSGIKYYGDQYQSALRKFKLACEKNKDMTPFHEYYRMLNL